MSEGRVGAICFYFPRPLAFFGFSPHTFLIRAKMHKSRKETKGRTHDPPFKHILCEPTREMDLMGEVGVVVFLSGWVDVGAKKKI